VITVVNFSKLWLGMTTADIYLSQWHILNLFSNSYWMFYLQARLFSMFARKRSLASWK